MQGTIEAVKQWPDGGMSLKVQGQWYKTKNPELMQMQGQMITFTPHPWTNPTSGKVTNYINDYVESGAAPGSADAAFQQAHAQQPGPSTVQAAPSQAPQSAPQVGKDRDASIVAQALTKACTAPGDDVQKVWSRYMSFYRFYMGWDGSPEGTRINAPEGVPFDDDLSSIPF